MLESDLTPQHSEAIPSEVNNLNDFPTREYFSGANLADWFRFEG
jgi:hypothetical protein